MKALFNYKKIGADLDTLGYLVDVLMILLIISNLSLIVFDWLFSIALIERALISLVPSFAEFYRRVIHEDFFFWDLIFVSIYLTEFTIRWLEAMVRKSYHRWFFYPFVHWYDLLGCIPVGSFRWLRVLRIFSLLSRLQKRGIVDLRQTRVGTILLKYYNIIVEEVADRVVLNVLNGVQTEIRQGNPLIHRIEDQVLAPRKSALVDLLAEKLIHAGRSAHRQWRDELGHYLAHLVEQSLTRSESGRRLAAIPVAGQRAMAAVSDSARDVGLAITDQLIDDLSNPDHRHALDQLLNDLIDELAGDRAALNQLVRSTLLDILDAIKAQISVQQWKLNESASEEGL